MAEVEDIEPEEEKSGGGMLKIILVVLLVLLVGVGSVLGTLFFVGFFEKVQFLHQVVSIMCSVISNHPGDLCRQR